MFASVAINRVEYQHIECVDCLGKEFISLFEVSYFTKLVCCKKFRHEVCLVEYLLRNILNNITSKCLTEIVVYGVNSASLEYVKKEFDITCINCGGILTVYMNLLCEEKNETFAFIRYLNIINSIMENIGKLDLCREILIQRGVTVFDKLRMLTDESFSYEGLDKMLKELGFVYTREVLSRLSSLSVTSLNQFIGDKLDVNIFR